MKYITNELVPVEHEIHYVSGTYKPPHTTGERFITIQLIPGATGVDTVIQPAPKTRKKTSFVMACNSYDEFLVWQNLYLNMIDGQLVLPGNYTFDCIISSMGEPDKYPFNFEFDIEFIEI